METKWIYHEAGSTLEKYCASMRGSTEWGGNIEIAAFSVLKDVHVHVYTTTNGEFHRTTCVHCPVPTNRVIHLLYVSKSHYDLLEGGFIVHNGSSSSTGGMRSPAAASLPSAASKPVRAAPVSNAARRSRSRKRGESRPNAASPPASFIHAVHNGCGNIGQTENFKY